MEQKTEASQAVDLPFPPMPLPVVKHAMLGGLFDRFSMQQYAMRYADLVVAALKAQPAPTEAAQGSSNSPEFEGIAAQGEDSARLDAAIRNTLSGYCIDDGTTAMFEDLVKELMSAIKPQEQS